MGFFKPSRKAAVIQQWQQEENARRAREQAEKEAAAKKAATEAERVAALSAAASPGQGSKTVANVRGFTTGAGSAGGADKTTAATIQNDAYRGGGSRIRAQSEGGADTTTAATIQTDAYRGGGLGDSADPIVVAPDQTDGGTDLGGVTSGNRKRRRGIVGLDI